MKHFTKAMDAQRLLSKKKELLQLKVLVVVRLYSPMMRSVVEGRWIPEGMPAFYKLVEGLNHRGIQADVVFLCKNVFSEIRQIQFQLFDALEHVRFFIVPIRSTAGNRVVKIQNEYYQFRFVWKLFTRTRYDLIYCDRIHVHFAAVFALLRRKVVLRLFGVSKIPEAMNTRKSNWFPWLYYLSFKAPFSYVICSKDGSPGKMFMSRYMRQDMLKEWVFNGVDSVPESFGTDYNTIRNDYNLSPDAVIILTTGLIEPEKSPGAFLDAIIQLSRQNQHFLVINVGGGTLRRPLEKKVREHGLENRVIYTGRVPHSTIYSFLKQAHIYVSLNKEGNLSNAVLEAMNAGKCIVTFDKCPKTGRDEQIEDPELRDALVLIDRNRIAEKLPDTLDHLIHHPELIPGKEDRIRRYAEKHLKPWDERIAHEIDALFRLAEG